MNSQYLLPVINAQVIGQDSIHWRKKLKKMILGEDQVEE